MLNVDYKKVNIGKALKLGFIIMGIGIIFDVVLAIIANIIIRITCNNPITIDGTNFGDPEEFFLVTVLMFFEIIFGIAELITAIIAAIICYISNQKKTQKLQDEGKIDPPEKMFYEKMDEKADATISENAIPKYFYQKNHNLSNRHN